MTLPGGRATPFSTAVVVGVAVGATAGVSLAVGVGDRVAVCGAAALVLAGAVGAAGADRLRPLAAGGAALALPVVGFALVAVTTTTVVAQLRDVVPPGTVFLVLGATVATYGAAAVPGPALDRSSLAGAIGIGARVLGVTLLAVAVATVLQFAPSARVVEWAVTAVLAPAPGRVHLGTWLALLAAAALGLSAAGRSLPVAAALAPRIDDAGGDRLATAIRRTWMAGFALAVAAALAVTAEALAAPYAGLPAPVRAVAVAVTGAAPLRWLLALVALASAAAAGPARLLGGGYRATGSDLLAALAPYAAAVAVVAATVATADRAVPTLIDELAVRLPAELTPGFRELAPGVVDVYGPTLLALVVLVAATAVASLSITAAFLLVVSGLLPRRATGAAVASTGVFATAAFAATVGATLPVTLAGVLAGVLVWDAGEFGATLRRELGRGTATTRTELVHAGGTVLVGGCTLVAALVLLAFVREFDAGSVPVVPALAAALAGAVLLAVASR